MNTVALYDLERFAPERYVVVSLSDMFASDANSVLEQVFIKLGEKPFLPDMSEVDERLRFNDTSENQVTDEADLAFRVDDVQRLVRAEKEEIIKS